MQKYIFLLFIVAGFGCSISRAQENSIITLSPEQAEAIFLKNNLQLIAERMNVDMADAAITQARLWDNPNLSIGQIGFPPKSEGELIPPLFGNFGKNMEFGVELSQMIKIAGQRGKLIEREKASKEISLQDFEIVLCGLKLELRQSLSEICYLQAYIKTLKDQQITLEQLITAYQKQVQERSIAKSELLRLQSSVLDLENELNQTQVDLNNHQKKLKILLNADPLSQIIIDDQSKEIKKPENILLTNLLNLAVESRPDVKKSELQTQYYDKSLRYEKSLRVPDLSINAGYDRGGNAWNNFFGFGIGIDLPFFNRNQGNIKAAQIAKDQSQYLFQDQQNVTRQEVTNAYNNYITAYNFYKKINDNSLLKELDSMLEIYTKNLLNRNISMLEYIDFMNAYKTSKQTVLTAKENLNLQFEELQYSVGTEIK